MRRLADGVLARSARRVRAWLGVLAAIAARLRLSRAGAGGRVPECRTTRKYQALLTLPPAATREALAPLPWPAMRAVVRARDHRTRAGRLLTALVTTEDGPAQPGNSHVIATMVVVGPHPDDCLEIGDSFTLWRGIDLARGVITRRLFT
jgi:hypothetical protein